MTDTPTAMLSDPAYRVNDGWLLVGRILIILMFFFSGASKAMDIAGTTGAIASKGLPMPQLLAVLTAVLEIVASVAILAGWHTRWAAVSLIGFTLIATYFFHDFWNLEGAARKMQMIHAMKNTSVIGGLIMLAAAGGGRYSLDARVRAGV